MMLIKKHFLLHLKKNQMSAYKFTVEASLSTYLTSPGIVTGIPVATCDVSNELKNSQIGSEMTKIWPKYCFDHISVIS